MPRAVTFFLTALAILLVATVVAPATQKVAQPLPPPAPGGRVPPPIVVTGQISPAPSSADAESEEQTLWAAGLGTDGPALLEFFHARVRPNQHADKLLALARKLGDSNAEVRSNVTGQLVSCGPAAIPVLRRVLNDLEDRVAADNAKICLEWLEGSRRTAVPIAAARVLAKRKPTGACEALLAYLPLADDGTVVDSVKGALLSLTKPPAKTDGALLKALVDPVPLRRAVAVEVLSGSGQPDVLPEVRKLLGDPKPEVRLRAALALAQQWDEQAIGVLIDLLADLSPADRRQVEEALQQLAGEWAPNPALTGDDEVARKIRRAAWAGWWQSTDGPTLLAAFRKRTLTAKDLEKVLSLIDKLGDKVFANRERAAADLSAMGYMVKPLLQEAAKSTDLERARRAELCLKQIAQSEDKHKLPPAAARLLAVRKPAGATETLLNFLPFTDDEPMREEIGKSLKFIAVAAGKPEPLLVKTLTDALAMRRAIAAEAIAGAGFTDQWPAIRKLLNDPDPAVRLRVAVALIYAQDKEAVPALIDMAAELPRDQAWQAEELLHRLAGDKAPATAAGNDTAARKKFREDWQAWWKSEAAKVDLAKLEALPAVLGYTLVMEFAQNGNGGRLVEVDRKGKVLWQIDNNVHFPVDARLLPGKRVLAAELNANRITERDLKGTIVWEINNLQWGNVANVQRLANGNTFIAFYGGPVMEVDKTGKNVLTIQIPNGARAAIKMANGQIICITQQNIVLQLDATGKELKRFTVNQPSNNAYGALDVTPKGTVLLSHNDNTIREYDLDGKTLWQAKSPGGNITSATRSANGHTLVACGNTNTIYELDAAGRVVWEYRSPPGFQPFRARQR
ncbi:MAG TPA: HEAT repeat domain-containing protein [Gemmataceae bacterium]|nr:HEAT repeat domain-containing protein [Gemmataceae bacterium]